MNEGLVCTHCGLKAPPLVVSPELLEHVVETNQYESPALELAAATGCSPAQASAWLAHLNTCAFALPLSTEDEAVLARVAQAFAQVSRPDNFVGDPNHCPECAEHEATLQAAADSHLSRDTLGGIGWDPMCFCGEQGLGYFFPQMARYALFPEVPARDWYGQQLLYRLTSERDRPNRFWRWCSTDQRAAVADFLVLLAQRDTIQAHHLQADAAEALSLWQRAQV